MYETAESKHFTLVHHIKRRVRIITPGLRKDQERAYILEMLLNKRQGIFFPDSYKVHDNLRGVVLHGEPSKPGPA